MKKFIEFLISLFKKKRPVTPSPTPVPYKEPKCFQYYFENEGDNDVNLDVLDCDGNQFSIIIYGKSSGNTLCLKTLTDEVIRDYEGKNVKIIPNNGSCG